MNLMESLDYRLNVRAKGKLAPDMALHACCTDFTEETLDEIPKMIEFGVPSMKLFLAYKPTPLYMDDFKYLSCLKKAAEHGMTMMVHAENPDVLDFERNSMAEKGCLEPKYHYMTWPPYGEAEAVSRAIRFADAAGCPGAGDRLNALWTYGVEKGKITRQKLVDIFATQPAKLNGIFPQKGTIDIGTDGDLEILEQLEDVVKNIYSLTSKNM